MKWIRENIEKTPSLTSFIEQVVIIEENIYSNPTLCVETCKSLIEGICKTILTNKNIPIATSIKFHILVQDTITSILNEDETHKTDIADLGRRVASVSQKLSEIRNKIGFVSHGMDVLNPKLTETLSVFSYKITDTIGGFILSCYNNNRVISLDHRIHYEDCKLFNEFFDELNPIPLGVINLSASLALFEQDYEAYKASYFEYLSDLESESEFLGLVDEQ
jgi:hypothetical protein